MYAFEYVIQAFLSFSGGNWGENCKNTCPCQNGGRCESYTGQCLCSPGWHGIHCQDSCDQDYYGINW